MTGLEIFLTGIIIVLVIIVIAAITIISYLSDIADGFFKAWRR